MSRDRALALLAAFVNAHSSASYELGILKAADGAELDLTKITDEIDSEGEDHGDDGFRG